MITSCKKILIALLRISLGWIFFWAFIDKLFGLGFDTSASKSWLAGVSPTAGFLQFASRGPLQEVFKSLAGQPAVDWLFMIGLGLIGLSLLLGIGLKLAGYGGAVLVTLMWLAVLPPEHNPLIDEHIIYLIIFLILPIVEAGNYWGFGKWWSQTHLVKKYPFLK